MRWWLCLLASGHAGLLWAGAAEKITFTKDVAPLLWKHCAGCHRPGGAGPFPLLTYEDAAKRANFLRHITSSRRMPPWRPEPEFGSFQSDRRLSDSDLQTLARWSRVGAPKGDPKDLPPLPKFLDGWQLGEPDLVLQMAEPYKVPVDGADVYRCFVVPIPLTADRTIAAVEFRPGNRRVVLHADFYVANVGQNRKKDRADGQHDYGSFGHPGIRLSGWLGSWSIGTGPQILPELTGMDLPRGSDLILQVHYHPIGKEQTDRSALGLHFAKGPTRHFVTNLRIENKQLDIPAGKQGHSTTAQSDPLPVDVRVLSIAPHMHYLGREIKVTALLPDGQTLALVWIKDWDLHWQETYRFVKPVALPKGTVLRLAGTFDNSADNPQNPSDPPRRVRWGERPIDEMLRCSLQVIVDSREDMQKIAPLHAR
jgi:hypothetical protein